jgi:FkbM family methyltransferase
MSTIRKHFDQNHAALRGKSRKIEQLRKIRPTFLVSPFFSMFQERRVIQVGDLKIFADPTSHLGHELLTTGSYEPETMQVFVENINAGATILDIGANEGYFAAFASRLVGQTGHVIAVEPQSRLLDTLCINLSLNAKCSFDIVHAAVGAVPGSVSINLFPTSNSGATSIVRKYRFGRRSEKVELVTPLEIVERCGLERIDFVKIDVEGFEPEVMDGLIPLIERGQIHLILLDYHASILALRGIDPAMVHERIRNSGMVEKSGAVGRGYVLYEYA